MERDQIKADLRTVRDQLAFEGSRARAQAQAPAALGGRLGEAADLVGRVFLLLSDAPAGGVSAALDELCADALAEARLALGDWEAWRASQRQKPRAPVLPPAERRQHQRHETTASVTIMRHTVSREGVGVELRTDSASRPARNVSLGGMFVAAGAADLAGVGVGSVLHVSVAAPGSRSFRARGAVMRRDPTGIALRWIVESAADQQVIDALNEAMRRASSA